MVSAVIKKLVATFGLYSLSGVLYSNSMFEDDITGFFLSDVQSFLVHVHV